jgi:hypothetical protein
MAEDKDARDSVEKGSRQGGTSENPVAGPHAKDHLTDNEKTPGTGALPDSEGKEADIGSD